MTITWQIFDTKSQIADGLITTVVYGCTAELDTIIDRKIGEVLLTGDVTASDFVPFSELTEQTVLGWVKSTLGEEQVAAIESQLTTTVTAYKAAKDAETTKSGLPWR